MKRSQLLVLVMTVYQKGKATKVHNFDTNYQLNIVYGSTTKGRVKRTRIPNLQEPQKRRKDKKYIMHYQLQRKRQRTKKAKSAANEDNRQQKKHKQRNRKRQKQQIGLT